MKKCNLLLALSIVLMMPFFALKETNASTNVTLYSSSLFDYGAYNVYYAANTGGYVITDMFDFIQVPMQWESCTITEVAFNNYYDGLITMKFQGNISTNLWECYLEGEGAYITNLSSTDVTIMLVHCQKFYIYGFCGNDNDINLRPKTSQPFVYPNGSLTPYNSGSEQLVNYERSIISTFNYHENYNYTDSNHPDYEYNSSNLNSNSYTYKQSSNRGVKRINITMKISNYTSGNYYVFNLYFASNEIMSEAAFNNLRLRTRDDATTRVYDVSFIKYQTYNKFNDFNQSFINLVLYVPITQLSEYRDSAFQLDFLGFDVNVRAVKFAYLGMVENMLSTIDHTPIDQTLYNNTSTAITDTNTVETSIQGSFNNAMNNINLNDYGIGSTLYHSMVFLTDNLQQIFNKSGEFKILFTLPLVLGIALFFIGRGSVVFRQGNIDRSREHGEETWQRHREIARTDYEKRHPTYSASAMNAKPQNIDDLRKELGL